MPLPLPVAIVTAAGFREIDLDLPLIGAALEAAGAVPTVEVWDDPAVDWGKYAGVVVRSSVRSSSWPGPSRSSR